MGRGAVSEPHVVIEDGPPRRSDTWLRRSLDTASERAAYDYGYSFGEENAQNAATYRAVDALAEALAAIARPVWNYGDGEGGTVTERIALAFEHAGYPVPSDPMPIRSRVARLANRDGWECHYCGHPLGWGHPSVETPQVEHKIPQSRGGTNTPDNLVLSCMPCNTRKGVATHDAFCTRCDEPF